MSGRFEFVLDNVEACVVGQALDVDIRRFPLRIQGIPSDPVRLAKLATIVTGELTKRRLVVGGEIHAQLRAAFEVIGQHVVSVAITGFDSSGADIAALAFTDGARAVRITQRPTDELDFCLFSDDDLVDLLAEVLPAMRAAPGPPATVRSSAQAEYRSAVTAQRAAERHHDEVETDAFGNISIISMVEPTPERRHRGRDSDGAGRATNAGDDNDERRLRRVLAGTRFGGGHITVTGRRSDTDPTSLSWLDVEDGRFLVHTTDDEGEFVARYEPADFHGLARAVREALSHAY
ncbi:EspG family [Prauserella sp. Am3]|nr:EspG family [Prauserella sp. Am3]